MQFDSDGWLSQLCMYPSFHLGYGLVLFRARREGSFSGQRSFIVMFRFDVEGALVSGSLIDAHGWSLHCPLMAHGQVVAWPAGCDESCWNSRRHLIVWVLYRLTPIRSCSDEWFGCPPILVTMNSSEETISKRRKVDMEHDVTSQETASSPTHSDDCMLLLVGLVSF